MLKQIYNRVLQLGSENTTPENTKTETISNTSPSKTVLVENEDKLPEAQLEEVVLAQDEQQPPLVTRSQVADADDDEDDDDSELETTVNKDDDALVGDDDPLAPGYDLDDGKPLRDLDEQQNFPGLPVRAAVDSAKEFFKTEFIYRYDLLDDAERAPKAGRYRFELKGFQGGIWTLILNQDMEIVNRREEADIVYTMQQKDFVHIVNGDINPQLAILAKKLRITGDMRKAINFLDLFVPGVD